jgi:hypothetical protein
MVMALKEAWTHAYYAGRRAGRDVTVTAWQHWRLRYWPIFLGHRRYEHLLGFRRYQELPEELCGIILVRESGLSLHQSILLEDILYKLRYGAENLDIIQPQNLRWMDNLLRDYGEPPQLHGFDIRREAVQILDWLRINDMRP